MAHDTNCSKSNSDHALACEEGEQLLLETLAAEHAERKLLLEALAILEGKRWASKGLPDSTSSKAATGSTHPVRKQSYDAKKRKKRAAKLAGSPLKSAHASYEELHIAVRSKLALEYEFELLADMQDYFAGRLYSLPSDDRYASAASHTLMASPPSQGPLLCASTARDWRACATAPRPPPTTPSPPL